MTSKGAPRSRRPLQKGSRTLSDLKSTKVDQETRKLAILILEVLAGVKTPSESAELLGVSLPRYYALESRALVGLLEACQRRPRGPQRNPDREIQSLRREVDRLESECARHLALLRVAQRAVGLSSRSAKTKDPPPEGKKRRKRKPVARALRAARVLDLAAAKEKDVEAPVAASENADGEETVK